MIEIATQLQRIEEVLAFIGFIIAVQLIYTILYNVFRGLTR